jgi:hypothetical protein
MLERKHLLLALAGVLAVLATAACGGSAGGSDRVQGADQEPKGRCPRLRK